MKIAARVCVCAITALTFFQAPTAFAALTSATDNSFTASHQTLFGARESYGGDLSTFRQWTAMEARAQTQRASSPALAEWTKLVTSMQGKTVRQKVEIANAAINAHPYVPTQRNWNRAMYWETPFEFLSVGGQCQDYAIAKYELLREAGVPADQLQMVVLHASNINTDHAVLVAYVDGESLLLDNLRRQVVSTGDAGDYRPYYAINEMGWSRLAGGQAMPTRVAYGAH